MGETAEIRNQFSYKGDRPPYDAMGLLRAAVPTAPNSGLLTCSRRSTVDKKCSSIGHLTETCVTETGVSDQVSVMAPIPGPQKKKKGKK